jgi:hypothetical protein
MIEEALARRELERAAALRGFGSVMTETVPGGIDVRRVRGGWLGWVDRHDAPSGARTGIRLELRDADNEPFIYPGWTLQWPLWPADVIAARIDAATDHDRFPPYVQAVLDVSGWFPGRAIPDHHLDDLATQFAALPVKDEEDLEEGERVYRPVVHEAARTALQEFGGLQLSPANTGRGLHIAPDPGHTWDATPADDFGLIFKQEFCLVGHHQDSQVLMAPNGLCLLAGLFDFRVGASFDEMITFILTHRRPFPLLDIDAELADLPADPRQP